MLGLWFDLEDAPAVFHGWRELSSAAPRVATFNRVVGDLNGRPLASVGFVWIGDPDEAVGCCLSCVPSAAVRRAISERSYVDLQRMDNTIEGHAPAQVLEGPLLHFATRRRGRGILLHGTADGWGEHLPAASLQAYGGVIADVPDADAITGIWRPNRQVSQYEPGFADANFAPGDKLRWLAGSRSRGTLLRARVRHHIAALG